VLYQAELHSADRGRDIAKPPPRGKVRPHQSRPRQAAVAQPVKKGHSGNPRDPRPKNLPELLLRALDEPVIVTTDGHRRQITKREAVIAQLVDKSTGADLRATKMLIDMLKDIEKRAGVAPPPEAPQFMPADEEVVENLLARLRRMELRKIHHGDTDEPLSAL
jgi:hypothetical protein